jgi:hypothetical protein
MVVVIALVILDAEVGMVVGVVDEIDRCCGGTMTIWE